MRLPIRQMTIRRWMIAVAVMGRFLAVCESRESAIRRQFSLDRAEVAHSHREEYLEKAADSRRRATQLAIPAMESQNSPKFSKELEEMLQQARGRAMEMAELCDSIARTDADNEAKHRRAARRLEMPVALDPWPSP